MPPKPATARPDLERDAEGRIGYGSDGIFDEGVHPPFEPFGSERCWYGNDQGLIVYVDPNRAT